MDAHRFDQLQRQLAQGRSRRALVGGSLGASLLAALGGGEETAAKARSERCVPAGRRCGAKKDDRSCKACCHRNHVTTPKGKKKCACKSDGIVCGNDAQCCSSSCQGGVCRSGPRGAALSEVGNGVISPTDPGCDPQTATGCQQQLSGVITGGTPIASGTFAGPFTVRNLVLTPDNMNPETGTGDVSGSVTLTESGTGAQLITTVNGRATITFDNPNPGTFAFSGAYTITGGTGRLAGASGTGTATFSGITGLPGEPSTVTAFNLSGIIIV